MGEYVNSRQLRIDKSLISCGVLQAHHIPKNIRGAVMAMATALYHKANPRPAAFFIWSDVFKTKSKSRGQLLEDKLLELKVGRIVRQDAAQNPRTGNMINVWVFRPDHVAFRKWYEEAVLHQVESEEEEVVED